VERWQESSNQAQDIYEKELAKARRRFRKLGFPENEIKASDLASSKTPQLKSLSEFLVSHGYEKLDYEFVKVEKEEES